ncbi:MAG: TRAP transporter large permease subunit [Chloroflexi bacterium]|nr:TRAP transporter large permease subunit [Chloroflexota bacterium]
MQWEWWVSLLVIGGILISFFLSGLPVAFAFLTFNIIGFVVFMGGVQNLSLLVPSAFASVTSFAWVPAPLFIFMGEIIFQSGLAKMMVDSVAKWIGRIHGSLSLVGIAAGTIFAMMSGSSLSGVAVFGSTLVPEMKRRGYQKPMIYAPILAAGGLATLIPPSVLTVILAALAQQSLGKLLVASFIPGFMLAALYATYILVRGKLQPHLAPDFAPPRVTWRDRMKAVVLILPLGIIIFLVLGVIFVGVATPTEAAALGAVGTVVLAAAYRRLTWQGIKKALMETAKVNVMVFTIIMSATAFSQVLAFTGATRELAKLAVSLPIAPILIVAATQVVMIVAGMFMDTLSMMMIFIPIFFPAIHTLGLDPIWYGILMLVNLEMAGVSPPFGLLLFTLKGVVPDATMGDIYRAGIPVCLLIGTLLALLLFFPSLVTILPQLMKGG